MDSIKKKLIKSGLSIKEAAIYSYLISSGGAHPSKIAEETQLNRTTVYSLLAKMSVQGLISEIQKGKKKFFQIEKPQRLVNAAKYKIRLAEESYQNAEIMVPILSEILNKATNKPKVQFYNTYETVVSAYMKHIEVSKNYNMMAFFSPLNLKDFLPKKKFKHYIKEKERLGITVRAIASEGDYVNKFGTDMFRGIQKNIWPNIRVVKEKVFPFPGEITLYDNDKISIVKFDKIHPVAVLIHDQDIFNMVKTIWEMSWIHAHPIKNL